ncbi:MAG TPA: ABC transporter ATP-binding protein [Labilithrix sp.]|nr:ABC transporter ATP-binding protein [Labilithrix sp.]
MPILETIDLRKTYQRGGQESEALRGVSITIERGEFVTMMGPSGSGKSTFLHLAGALDRATSGRVLVDGHALTTMDDASLSRFRRTRLGFVFQFFNLLPTLTAVENVALPLLLEGESLPKVTKKARELLASMGIGHRADHKPTELSGGEMQRVAIARALIGDPALVLADEPTGNLDSNTGTQVLELLREATRKRNLTLLMVTHDPRAAAYGSRLVKVRDGRVESDVPVASEDRAKLAG